jgi:glycosyltransferase involved in cell wall biosynthesis
VNRIVHIIVGVRQGGAEKILADVVNARAGGLEHHVVSLLAGEPYFAMNAASFHSLGLTRGQLSPGAVRRLRAIVRRLEPNLVQGWLYHGNFASLFVRDLSPTLLWSIHNTDLPVGSSKLSTRLIDRLCALFSRAAPDRIVYASEPARRVHERLGYAPAKGTMIENGIDLDAFRSNAETRNQVRRALDVSEGERLIGCIARFDPQKDHRTLIRSFASVVRQRPDARLVLVGDGCMDQNVELTQWLQENSVAERALLLGQRSDIGAIMSALDLLVIASAYGEALPLVALEAAAADLPLVATDVGEVRPFVLDPEDVVPPRDPERLADAILRALNRGRDPASEPAHARRRRLEQRFSRAAMVARYGAVYATRR